MEESVPLSPRPSLGALALGIFFSPHKTMAAIVEHPTWLFPLLLTAVLSGVGASVIYKPIIVPIQISKMEAKSQDMPAGQLDKMEQQMNKPVWAAVTGVGWVLLAAGTVLVMAAMLYFLGSLIFGGQSTFKAVFSVVAWTSLIAVLSMVLQTPIRLLRVQGMDPTDFPAALESLGGLGFLVPANSGSFAMGMARGVLGSIELFWLWQCAVLVEGVALAFKKPRSFGLTCVAVIWVLGALLAAVAGGFQAKG